MAAIIRSPTSSLASGACPLLLESDGRRLIGTPLYPQIAFAAMGLAWPVSLDVFREYFRGPAQTWERLALTRARAVFSTGGFGRTVNETIREVLANPLAASATSPGGRRACRKPRGTRQGRNDLNAGYGGLADIEFLVHYLQLAHAKRSLDPPARPCVFDASDGQFATGRPRRASRRVADLANRREPP